MDVSAVRAGDDDVGEGLDVLDELLEQSGAELQVDDPEGVPLEQGLRREQPH